MNLSIPPALIVNKHIIEFVLNPKLLTSSIISNLGSDIVPTQPIEAHNL